MSPDPAKSIAKSKKEAEAANQTKNSTVKGFSLVNYSANAGVQKARDDVAKAIKADATKLDNSTKKVELTKKIDANSTSNSSKSLEKSSSSNSSKNSSSTDKSEASSANVTKNTTKPAGNTTKSTEKAASTEEKDDTEPTGKESEKVGDDAKAKATDSGLLYMGQNAFASIKANLFFNGKKTEIYKPADATNV
jgi:hypothetical protein